jgi:hypothetical protein
MKKRDRKKQRKKKMVSFFSCLFFLLYDNSGGKTTTKKKYTGGLNECFFNIHTKAFYRLSDFWLLFQPLNIYIIFGLRNFISSKNAHKNDEI